MTDYQNAVAAQDGDKNAELELWNKYKGTCLGILGKVAGMDVEDKESEAYLLFHHKLYDLFDRTKIGVSPEAWTFSFMIIGGCKNLRNKLIRQSIRDQEFCNFAYIDGGGDDTLQDAVNVDVYGDHTFDQYNTEALVIRDLIPLSGRVKRFYAKLTVQEKVILVKRRAGMLVREIAEEMDCSVSTIKLRLQRARQIANQEILLNFA